MARHLRLVGIETVGFVAKVTRRLTSLLARVSTPFRQSELVASVLELRTASGR
jgi:hypothetical protein